MRKSSSRHRTGLWLTVGEWVASCWSLRVCLLLQNSSVQPWFHLIQFPSNPLCGQGCPLSFLHPDNFIFYFSPLSFHLFFFWPTLQSTLLLTALTLPPFSVPPSHFAQAPSSPSSPSSSSTSYIPSPSCQSALWCGDRWCVLDLVMSPSPLPHSRLYWPITPLHSLTPFFPLFFLSCSVSKCFCSLTNLSSFSFARSPALKVIKPHWVYALHVLPPSLCLLIIFYLTFLLQSWLDTCSRSKILW